ncbi:MAG TPA: hypothetical protein ENK13_05565, partial [Thermopetrobacter sp.]|nr:hypothetical protein [Thermopetrobacter sp.]
MSESVEILPPLQRVAACWRAQDGRPQDSRAAFFEAVLEDLVTTGDAAAVTLLLQCAAADPRLLGDAATAIMAWLNGAGHAHDDPFLRLELVRMQGTHREALTERGTPPPPSLLEAPDDPHIAARLREALEAHAGEVREVWLMRRARCATLPGWRHYDLLLEMRPGALLGRADVPGHIATVMTGVRDRIARLWLDDATVAVHAYPVHVDNALLNFMRGHALPLLHPPRPAPVMTPPALRGPVNDAPEDDIILAPVADNENGEAATGAPALRGTFPPEEDDLARTEAEKKPAAATAGKEERSGLLPPVLGEAWRNFTRNRPLMMGITLLPALIGWYVLTTNGETRARIAALEQARQNLLQERAWRTEEGAAIDDPLHTIAVYRQALGALDATPSLPIYTEPTRRFLLGRFRSRAGMQREWAALAECGNPRPHISADRAVVTHAGRKAACAPFFLRLEGGRWRLDLETRMKAVTEDE